MKIIIDNDDKLVDFLYKQKMYVPLYIYSDRGIYKDNPMILIKGVINGNPDSIPSYFEIKKVVDGGADYNAHNPKHTIKYPKGYKSWYIGSYDSNTVTYYKNMLRAIINHLLRLGLTYIITNNKKSYKLIEIL